MSSYLAHGQTIYATGKETRHVFRVNAGNVTCTSDIHSVSVSVEDGATHIVVLVHPDDLPTSPHALTALCTCDPLPANIPHLDFSSVQVVGVQTPAGPYPLPSEAAKLDHPTLLSAASPRHPFVVLDPATKTIGQLVRADAVLWLLGTGDMMLARAHDVDEIEFADDSGAMTVHAPYTLARADGGGTVVLTCPTRPLGAPASLELIGRCSDAGRVDSEEAFVVRLQRPGTGAYTFLRHYGILSCTAAPVCHTAPSHILTLWSQPTDPRALRTLRLRSVAEGLHDRIVRVSAIDASIGPVLEETAQEPTVSNLIQAVICCEPKYGQPVAAFAPAIVDQTVHHPPVTLSQLAQTPDGTISARFETPPNTPGIAGIKLFAELPQKLLLDWSPTLGRAVNAYGRASWVQESRTAPDTPFFAAGPRGRNTSATNVRWQTLPLAVRTRDSASFGVDDGVLFPGCSPIAFEELQQHPALFVRVYFSDGTVAYRVWLGEREGGKPFRNPLWEAVAPVLQPIPNSPMFMYTLAAGGTTGGEGLLMHAMMGMSERRMSSGTRRLVVLDPFRQRNVKLQAGIVATSNLAIPYHSDPTEQYGVSRAASVTPPWAKSVRGFMMPNAAGTFWRYSVNVGAAMPGAALSSAFMRIYPHTAAGLEPTIFDPALRKTVTFPLRTPSWTTHRAVPRGVAEAERHMLVASDRLVRYRCSVPLASVIVELRTMLPVVGCGLIVADDPHHMESEDMKSTTATLVGLNGALPVSFDIDSVAQRCTLVARTETTQTFAVDVAGRFGFVLGLSRPEAAQIQVPTLRALTLAGDSVYVTPRIVPVGTFSAVPKCPHAVQLHMEAPSAPFTFTVPSPNGFAVSAHTPAASAAVSHNSKAGTCVVSIHAAEPVTLTLFDPAGVPVDWKVWGQELVTDVFAIHRDDSAYEGAAEQPRIARPPLLVPAHEEIFFPERTAVAVEAEPGRNIETRFGVHRFARGESMWLLVDPARGLDPANLVIDDRWAEVERVQNKTLWLEPVPHT